jgi:HEPN domain-containing protein
MFLSPDDLRILTGRAHKPLEKEMMDLINRLETGYPHEVYDDCRNALSFYEDITDEAAKEIKRLLMIEKAARNFVTVRGRYNTEQAYKRLEEALK